MAADLGDMNSQLDVAYRLLKGDGCRADASEAMRYFKMAGDQGSLVAQFNYASFRHDEAGRARSLTLAVERGETWAPIPYANHLRSRPEVGDNLALAATFMKQAADQGSAPAQFEYGRMLADGEGVPRDLDRAARYLKLASDQGIAGARWAGTMVRIRRLFAPRDVGTA